MGAYAANPNVDPASLLGPIEDTTDIWVSMRSDVREAETAQGYEPIIIFHPTAGRIARPVSTPAAIGPLMFPREEDRVSIDAVQSGHATPDALGAFTPWDSTKNYELIAAMRDGFTGPVLDLENHYEGAHDNFDLDYMICHKFVQVCTTACMVVPLISRTAPTVYGKCTNHVPIFRDSDYYDLVVNQNASGSWRRDIFFEGATQAQYITEPLQNLSIEELELLEPARLLLASPNGYTDVAVNAFDSTRFISVLASVNHDRFYVYTGHGDSFSLKVGNGSVRSGTTRWFSPRDGQYYAGSTVDIAANSNYVDFTPPSGGSVDNDWFLVLQF